MDSNENENYSYKGAIPKATKYHNQFNNNLAEQENLMPKTNGTVASNGQKCATVDCNTIGIYTYMQYFKVMITKISISIEQQAGM